MSKAVAEIAIGATEIAAGIVTEVFLPGNPFGIALIASGGGMLVGGVGTLLTQQQGLAANARNSIQPWNVVYGQAKVGGTVVYIQETGDSDKYLHLIYVLACHPCNSIDAVLLDNKRVILSHTTDTIWDSVPPTQANPNIASIGRVGDVVTVTVDVAIHGMFPGDYLQIENITADPTLNGVFAIQPIDAPTGLQFTYICGGSPVTITGQGDVKTTWPDYGHTIHAEIALGNQTSNPFPGLEAGDDTGSNGLWTSQHALRGRTAIYLRLKYDQDTYAAGLPGFSFLVSGNNNIYDPRTGGSGYTPNAALCIADYLANRQYGFKAQYGTEIPTSPLIAAANICDEAVQSVYQGVVEPRYTCNGSFQVSTKRGEALQNLLTSCAGRLTYSFGQYVINPGAWTGTYVQAGVSVTNSAGSPAVLATLSAITTHIPGSPYDMGCIATDPAVHPIGVLDTRYWFGQSFAQGGSWTLGTSSMPIDPAQLGGLTFAFGMVPPTGIEDIADQLLVYDCWCNVTYADGTTGTYRPTTATVNTSLMDPALPGTVTNPNNAIDGDPTTAATISCVACGTIYFSQILILGSFNFPGITAVSSPFSFPNFAAGPFQWRPKVAVRDLFNGVKATYVCPANNWQASDMPPYAQDTLHGYPAPAKVTGYYDQNLASDNDERRWYEMQLPFTISSSMAQRIAKIELLRRRQQGMGTFIYNLAMYQVMPLDILALTVPFLGWTDKLLEVSSHRFTVTSDEGTKSIRLGTELDFQETDPSVYVWDTSEELSPQGNSQISLTGGTKTIAAPAGVTLANATVAGSGLSTGQVQVTWTAPTDGWITNGGQTIVQYSLDDTNWIGLGTHDSSVTTAYIPNVAAGQQYWVRTAFINAAGVQSAWTVQGPLTATGSALRRIDDETPTGTINGTNTSFALSQTPSPAASLQLYVNGDLALYGLDYTLSGATVTMTVAPKTGWWLRAYYWY